MSTSVERYQNSNSNVNNKSLMHLKKERSDFGFTPYNDQSGMRYGINLSKGLTNSGMRINNTSTKSNLSVN